MQTGAPLAPPHHLAPPATPSTVMLKSFPFALPGGASEQPGSPLPNPSLAVPQCYLHFAVPFGLPGSHTWV